MRRANFVTRLKTCVWPRLSDRRQSWCGPPVRVLFSILLGTARHALRGLLGRPANAHAVGGGRRARALPGHPRGQEAAAEAAAAAAQVPLGAAARLRLLQGGGAAARARGEEEDGADDRHEAAARARRPRQGRTGLGEECVEGVGQEEGPGGGAPLQVLDGAHVVHRGQQAGGAGRATRRSALRALRNRRRHPPAPPLHGLHGRRLLLPRAPNGSLAVAQ
eukprot:3649572-Prymnesium_polylepis.1